jgi:hypothetical protein
MVLMTEKSPFLIAHLFADVGVESEVLSAFGTVDRYSINPMDSPYNENIVQMDLTEEMPDVDERYDLAFLQPPCYRWTQRSDEDAEDLIPRAREIGQTIATEYVIENKPRAPLEAPNGGVRITLDGSMFGLPVEYERSFEVSYSVPRPTSPRHWRPEHRIENTRPYQYWKAVKGYNGKYPAKDFITNALPAPYVRWLVRPLLDGYQHRHSSQSQLTEVSAFSVGGEING